MKNFKAIILGTMAVAAMMISSCSTDDRGAALDKVIQNMKDPHNSIYYATDLSNYSITRVGDDIVLQSIVPSDVESSPEFVAAEIVVANPNEAEKMADLGTKVICIVTNNFGNTVTSVVPISQVLEYN